MPNSFRIICSTGHLSHTPLEPDSFRAGIATLPDAVCANAGSCDIGPYPMGSDECASETGWQAHDLEVPVAGQDRNT